MEGRGIEIITDNGSRWLPSTNEGLRVLILELVTATIARPYLKLDDITNEFKKIKLLDIQA